MFFFLLNNKFQVFKHQKYSQNIINNNKNNLWCGGVNHNPCFIDFTSLRKMNKIFQFTGARKKSLGRKRTKKVKKPSRLSLIRHVACEITGSKSHPKGRVREPVSGLAFLFALPLYSWTRAFLFQQWRWV